MNPGPGDVVTTGETLVILASSFIAVLVAGFFVVWYELRRGGNTLADLVRVMSAHTVAVSFPGRPDWNRKDDAPEVLRAQQQAAAPNPEERR